MFCLQRPLRDHIPFSDSQTTSLTDRSSLNQIEILFLSNPSAEQSFIVRVVRYWKALSLSLKSFDDSLNTFRRQLTALLLTT